MRVELEWGPESERLLSWQEAVKWCEQLGPGWRMATLGELRLAWEDVKLRATFKHQSGVYWSSSTYQSSPFYAWGVLFCDGDVFAGTKTNLFYVRAVRDGDES